MIVMKIGMIICALFLSGMVMARTFDSLQYDCQRHVVRNFLRAAHNSQMVVLSSDDISYTDRHKYSRYGLWGYDLLCNFTDAAYITTNSDKRVYLQLNPIVLNMPSHTTVGDVYLWLGGEKVRILDFNEIEYLRCRNAGCPSERNRLRLFYNGFYMFFLNNIYEINLAQVRPFIESKEIPEEDIRNFHKGEVREKYLNTDARKMSPAEYMKKYNLCGIYSNRVYRCSDKAGFAVTPISKPKGAGNGKKDFWADEVVTLSPEELSELIYLIYRYDDRYAGYSYDEALRLSPNFLLPVETIETNIGKMTEDTLIKKQNYQDMEVLMLYDYLNVARKKKPYAWLWDYTDALKFGNFEIATNFTRGVLFDMGGIQPPCKAIKLMLEEIEKEPLKASPLFTQSVDQYINKYAEGLTIDSTDLFSADADNIWGKESFYRAQSTPVADKGYYVSKLRFDDKDQRTLFQEVCTNSTLPLVELQEISNEIVAGRYRVGGLKAVAGAMLGADMRVTFDSSVNFLVNGKEKSIPFVIEEYGKTRNCLEKKCLLWTLYKIGVLNDETEAFLTTEIKNLRSSDDNKNCAKALADYASAVLARLRGNGCNKTP